MERAVGRVVVEPHRHLVPQPLVDGTGPRGSACPRIPVQVQDEEPVRPHRHPLRDGGVEGHPEDGLPCLGPPGQFGGHPFCLDAAVGGEDAVADVHTVKGGRGGGAGIVDEKVARRVGLRDGRGRRRRRRGRGRDGRRRGGRGGSAGDDVDVGPAALPARPDGLGLVVAGKVTRNVAAIGADGAAGGGPAGRRERRGGEDHRLARAEGHLWGCDGEGGWLPGRAGPQPERAGQAADEHHRDDQNGHPGQDRPHRWVQHQGSSRAARMARAKSSAAWGPEAVTVRPSRWTDAPVQVAP